MKNLIIITSVINTSKNPLDYTKVRSVYSQQERYEQTIKTIESCSKIKDKEIIFIETSKISENQEEEIKKKVDYYYNFLENDEIKNVIDGASKGSAESTQIWEGLKNINIEDYDNIIKISGRYWFSDDFEYENYNNNENIFKEGPNKSALATVMYKINKKDYELYRTTLNHSKDNNEMLEKNFVKFFLNKYITLPKIGVEGNVSVDGNYINW